MRWSARKPTRRSKRIKAEMKAIDARIARAALSPGWSTAATSFFDSRR